ncbi:hypothetical protein C8J56DRAFT_1042866 [Mycena floridula]|nr:hypothetical protein C8J56DRAFT_1042866 [Mycena floridula]
MSSHILDPPEEGVELVLLLFLCLAQSTDTPNNPALFTAIPPISVNLGIQNGTSVWLIGAYQLLLLNSSRMSDIYSASELFNLHQRSFTSNMIARLVFVLGTLLMSFTSLGAGFVRSEVPLIVLRAGVGAALNVLSAYIS